MADKSVGARIELKGEKEYSAAIKEAQRNLRVLKSELKAESAELGKNASEQDKNAAKAKSLKAQIAEQEKIIETMKAALEDARQKYGENSDAVAGWEIRLNNARATLGNMRSDLENAGGGVRDMGGSLQEAGRDADTATVATRSLAEALKDVGTFAGGISEKIEGLFTGMVETVSGAIGAVWDEMVSLAARANGWVDLAGFWNTSATNIQKWYHAVEGSHNSFDKMQGAVKKIVHGDAQKIAELAGVSREGYEDDWEYAIAVMDSLDRIGRTQGHEARQSVMEQIFGAKKVEDVQDILNDWGTIQDNLARFDTENGGVGMSAEGIQQMSTLAEKVSLIEETWSAFKDSWLDGLAPLALDLTSNVEGALDALIRFMNADPSDTAAREAALEDFKTNLTAFFTRLGEAISEAAAALDEVGGELEKSDNSMVRTIGKVLQSLSDLLEWFSNPDNIQTVIQGFEALAAFWLVGKGAELVTTISGLAANFAVIKGFGVTGAGASALSNAANSTATTAGATAGTAAGGSILGSLIKGGLPNLLLAYGVWEGVKKWAPSNFLSSATSGLLGLIPGGETMREVENIQKEAGIETVGDEVKNIQQFSQQQNQRAMSTMWGAVWNPGGGGAAETPAAAPTVLTPEQAAALEAYWDMNRGGEYDRQTYVDLENAFSDNLGLMNTLVEALDNLPETEYGSEDIPQGWYTDMKDTITVGNQNAGNLQKSIDVLNSKDFEGAVRRGASEGLSGVKVYLDGYAVGNLIADYVSEAIARNMDT